MTGSWKIHIVDDDEAVRASLLFALQATGFAISSDVDASGFLAREQYERTVLVCDVRMPGMSGLELTSLIRQRGSKMPIILITGHANDALKAEAMRAGADAILEKPTALAALLAEISRTIADRA